MTDAEITALVTRCVYEVAPEIEGEEIVPDEPLTDQFELDSMDQLNLVIGYYAVTNVGLVFKRIVQGQATRAWQFHQHPWVAEIKIEKQLKGSLASGWYDSLMLCLSTKEMRMRR
mgnify:CR=1 FL=1